MNGVIEGIFCPGIILPVHPDAMEDDSEADVEDEVDDAHDKFLKSDHRHIVINH